MAPGVVRSLRYGGVAVAVALLAWVIVQTTHAGSDIPAPMAGQQTQLSGGAVNGRRIDGKSWSLDYDTATMSQDGSIADIDNVKNGVLLRNGKPYMRMTAHHVTANVTYNDFVVTGPVHFTEVGGQHRRLDTVGAHYIGADHTLHLDAPLTIVDGAMTVRVKNAVVNFSTGQTTIGRIVGTM